jgi:hypothetical protein
LIGELRQYRPQLLRAAAERRAFMRGLHEREHLTVHAIDEKRISEALLRVEAL